MEEGIKLELEPTEREGFFLARVGGGE